MTAIYNINEFTLPQDFGKAWGESRVGNVLKVIIDMDLGDASS